MPRRARSRPATTVLQQVARRLGDEPLDRFPFSVPAIRTLDTLDVSAPVTLFVGENGSGKSTLLEAIAIAAQLPTAGSHESWADPTLAAQRVLADALRLGWTRKTRRGLFLRAEDFFGYAKRMEGMARELSVELTTIEEDYAGRSHQARVLATVPTRTSLDAVRTAYGDGLDARSHGQAFLAFLSARLNGSGLYLLDEPESPLSPQNQLGLVALLHDAVAQGAQCIIATHSPIVLAYPDARLYAFDEGPIREVRWDDLEPVRLLRDFLHDPRRYIEQVCGTGLELDLF
jgi:predicted ATPase